jgi:hypothetical protein
MWFEHKNMATYDFVKWNSALVLNFYNLETKKGPTACKIPVTLARIFPHWSMGITLWPERTYNPITAMGFSAMFTFQLDNTKR